MILIHERGCHKDKNVEVIGMQMGFKVIRWQGSPGKRRKRQKTGDIPAFTGWREDTGKEGCDRRSGILVAK